MVFPELESPLHEFNAPAAGMGGGHRGASEPENFAQEFDVGTFFTMIVTESKNPKVVYDFEEQLQNAGYLSELEKTGILPLFPENPNPYNIIQEREDHLLWARQHQEETEKYMHEVEQRENILRHIYIGKIIQNRLSER